MSRRDEAVRILDQALTQLMSPTRDIVAVMRSLQHACELMGWPTQQAWFHREVVGYGLETKIPDYRRVPCRLAWQPRGSAYQNTKWMSQAMVYGDGLVDEGELAQETEPFELRIGTEALLSHSHSGLNEDTTETKLGYLRDHGGTIPLRHVKIVDSETLRDVVRQIENFVFEFASKAIVLLKYGNTMGDIWTEYRAALDDTVSQLPFGNHLAAIDEGLGSPNPEMWRSAVLECRNLLSDIAGHLWRDSRITYSGLPAGGGKGGELSVSSEKFANRLRAYLHQKSVTGTRGSFLGDAATYLADAISSLKDFQCEAHQPIARQDARSVAIFTYLFLGELVRRTDMAPIARYEDAAGQQ
jgi:hypothetical protein